MPLLRKFSELVFGKQAVESFTSAASHLYPHQNAYQKRKTLIAREASVGANVLGPIPVGHNREFFCLDKNTWIWHESWKDEQGHYQQFTVNYEYDHTGILKRVNGGQYTKLQGDELARFDRAMRLYYQEVTTKLYANYLPALG